MSQNSIILIKNATVIIKMMPITVITSNNDAGHDTQRPQLHICVNMSEAGM